MTNERPADPTVENRRHQLRRWIEVHFDGNQAAFGASTADGEHQINQGELSGLLRTKSFGEKRARRLEAQANMPPGYLDSTSGPTDPSMAQFVAEPARARANANTRILWPFKLASYQRLFELRRALGRRADECLHDIDQHLDIVLAKWEREAQAQKKRAARR